MKQKSTDLAALAAAIKGGDRRALARAITLCESTRKNHRATAEALLDLIKQPSTDSFRLGISGAPGVGKSTFIESFGMYLLSLGHRVAVLAVDPSSSLTGGSILGDKTRMTELSRASGAFIRPSPAAGNLGGVARRTRDVMALVEAAGHDVVIVETVGVGQSETAVAEMTDIFLLLQAPGGGDDLQGIKRGIMELADLIVINKADGDFIRAARHAAADFRNALTLLRPKHPDWTPRVQLMSALKGTGLEEVWTSAREYREALSQTGALKAQRAAQAKHWLWQEIDDGLRSALRDDKAISRRISALEQAVIRGDESPSRAAEKLLREFLGQTAPANPKK